MDLKKLGERKIIDIFEKNFDKCEDSPLGIGDDAAVFDMDSKNYMVVSTDMLSQSTHIPREMTPSQIGKYAVNVNLSDIAAMGAKPLGLLFSFGLPGTLDERFVDRLSRGISDACREHGTYVLGGDTKKHGEIVIAGTAIGQVKKARLLTRGGASSGDIIGVTGKLGSAAAGFYCITKGIDDRKFIAAALEPKAKLKEGSVLSKYASACMDLSDGLAFSLHEVARRSEAGFRVHMERIPTDRGLRGISELSNVPVEEMTLHGGGDFELLFTAPKDKFEVFEREIDVTTIGEVTERGAIILKGGDESELEPRGYDAFLPRSLKF